MAVGLTSCKSPDTSSQTDWVNPNPEIEQLHIQAYNLDLGTGVKQDRAKANELYLKAAQAGDPRSMMNYAINLANGDGTKADLVEAFSWTDVARFLTQDSKDMKMRWRIRGLYDELKESLSPIQLKEAESRTRTKIAELKK